MQLYHLLKNEAALSAHAVCGRFSLEPCLEQVVSKRWFKSYQVECLGSTVERNHQEVDSGSEAGSSGELQVVSMPGPSFEKMNRNQRFNYAMRTLKAVADNLADCQPDVFAARLAFLESVNAAWLRQEDVALTHHEDEKIDVPGNTKVQDACLADTLHSKHVRQVSIDKPTGDNWHTSSSSATVGTTAIDASQEVTASNSSCEIRLPQVKSRGRPCKRLLQIRGKRAREVDDASPVPFKQLSEKARAKCKSVRRALWCLIYLNFGLFSLQFYFSSAVGRLHRQEPLPEGGGWGVRSAGGRP